MPEPAITVTPDSTALIPIDAGVLAV